MIRQRHKKRRTFVLLLALALTLLAGCAAKESGAVDRYCMQNDIPPRTKYRIRLTLEELAQQLLPRPVWTPFHVTVEYAPLEGEATVTVSYGGERFDPAEGGNELSCTVLRKSVEELRYSFDPAREMANSVCVRIREKP